MSNHNIIAVVVTYNRRELLSHTLKAIGDQTVRVNRIIVIDNASTDGTFESLNEREILRNLPCEYVRMKTNTGGAGGFHEGVKRAIDAGADWVWVMDDDVAAATDCLEQLLRWTNISECLMPRREYADGTECKWEHFVDIGTVSKTFLNDVSFRNRKQITFTNAACFEGMLVSRRIVELIGPPDKKYYIGEDDTLFGILASVHTNNVYVHDAKLTRLLQPQPKSRIAPERNFYFMRNRFYLFKDACKQLGIRPTLGMRLKFILLRTVEVPTSLSRGALSFFQTLRGYAVGLRYMLFASRSQR